MRYLFCTIPFLAFGLAPAQEFEPNDFDRLQGTWVVVSLTEKGKAVPAAEIETLEFVIEKNIFSAFDKGKLAVKYEIKLDPEKKPKQIDFTYLVGEDKGKTEPGIYFIDKDQVKFAMNEVGKDRPTVFDGKESEAYSVLVLKKKAK